MMLGRSAWAGSQRNGAATWSGDTQSTWDDFNHQFRAGLNMVMSGFPYWTTDIGPSIAPPQYKGVLEYVSRYGIRQCSGGYSKP